MPTRGVVYVHSAPLAVVPHVEWAIARVLGSRVGPHPDGLVEIGFHPVYPTAAGASYFEGATMFYQWHRETFEIPAGAVHLAHHDAFDAQAFRYDGHVYGVEFHPGGGDVARIYASRYCFA